MNKQFELDRWFDTGGEIDKVDAALTEAQLILQSVKNDIDPEGAQAHRERRAMYRAVDKHNRKVMV